MKKVYLLLSVFLSFSMFTYGQRFLDQTFDEVQVTKDIVYGANISVITGAPAVDTLVFDFYEPVGDTMAERPLLLYWITGSFLPIGLNGTTTGSKEDYTAVQFATEAAKKGWAVAVPTYRLGWNPVDTTAELRRQGLINAAYRALQDSRAFVRFMNMTRDDLGNPFRVNTEKITTFGQGAGGYISYVMVTLDDFAKIDIPKFQDPLTGEPFVNEALLGDVYGEVAAPLNIPNHVGYGNDVHFAFNLGGALGDISWLDENTVPVGGAHIILDPFAPFGIDQFGNTINEAPVIVPTTGEFVVTVAGTKAVIEHANASGQNDVLINSNMLQDDPLSNYLSNQPFGEINLWAIGTRGQIRSGLWEYWDPAVWVLVPHPSCGSIQPPACSFHTVNLQLNPNMSIEQADRYIDTLVNMFLLQSYIVLDLMEPSATNDLDESEVGFNMYPNPATDRVILRTDAEYPMQQIRVISADGRIVQQHERIDNPYYFIYRNELPPGIYTVQVIFEGGMIHKQVVFR